MDLVKALNSQYMKEELPEVKVGDTVRVHVRIKEGSRLAADYQGKKKIIAKLTAKGFSAGAVMKTVVRLEAEGKIDFTEARRRLISEKLPPESTKEEKLKLLHRYGYI